MEKPEIIQPKPITPLSTTERATKNTLDKFLTWIATLTFASGLATTTVSKIDAHIPFASATQTEKTKQQEDIDKVVAAIKKIEDRQRELSGGDGQISKGFGAVREWWERSLDKKMKPGEWVNALRAKKELLVAAQKIGETYDEKIDAFNNKMWWLQFLGFLYVYSRLLKTYIEKIVELRRETKTDKTITDQVDEQFEITNTNITLLLEYLEAKMEEMQKKGAPTAEDYDALEEVTRRLEILEGKINELTANLK